MNPRTAKNLSIVAFAALVMPVRNLLALLEALVAHLFRIPFPIPRMVFVLKKSPGPWGILTVSVVNLIPMAIAAILSVCLYRYLRARDFPRVAADCAARKGRVRMLAILFVFAFAIVLLSLFLQYRSSATKKISDLTSMSNSAVANASQLQEENRALEQTVQEMEQNGIKMQEEHLINYF